MSTALTGLMATFSGVFGLAALALAAVGIYGVVSYSARQRTREMGIRMALGATRAQVFRMVLRQGGVLTAWGLALGTAGALAAARAVRGVIASVEAADPLTFVAVLVLLTAVSLCASAIPALRVAHSQPMSALRHE